MRTRRLVHLHHTSLECEEMTLASGVSEMKIMITKIERVCMGSMCWLIYENLEARI